MRIKSMNYSIVVMSCDRYSDLWTPFIECFERYWPSCRAPVYLVSETLSSESNLFFKSITCGAGTEWTDRLDICLDMIETEYIILLCDDYLLCDQVDNEMIDSFVSLAARFNVGNLRMLPNPKPPLIFSEEFELGEYPRFTPYRIATQAGIWRTDFLKKFKDMHASIWGFERIGSSISNQYDEKLICTLRHHFPFEDAVHKGKWEQAGIKLCERNNIEIDFSRRSAMQNIDYSVKHGKGLIIDIAPNLVINMMNGFTKAKRILKK